MTRFGRAFLGILFLALVVGSAKIETGRYFHIQSFDGKLLTIGGGNSRGVKIVTEDARGSEPRQKFWVGTGSESHYISPEAQNALSSLVLDLDLPSSLLYQDHRRGARHQWWIVTDTGNRKWTIQNAANGRCLSANGKDVQVSAAVCDLSTVNQTWAFTQP